ncbi:MAG TPA: hypothetical protein DDW52_01045, partial [Planctomycetaceae bacterium]|nr:hypothetical protein [Planctomycetaceae bacterium]
MPVLPHVIGLDIGGANLKSASNRGTTHDQYFPLWKHPEQLTEALAKLLRAHHSQDGPASALALTMTGELADSFDNRSEGVRSILASVKHASDQLRCQNPPTTPPVYVYTIHGQPNAPSSFRWQSVETVIQSPLTAAASNWHCLATWIAARSGNDEEFQLLLDIGSTTTDVVPLAHQKVASASVTDLDRLRSGELVYTGIRRSPVCAVLQSVNIDNATIPLMAENFATSDDAYLALKLTDERPEDTDTADGRPRTHNAAMQRLSKMLGEDLETLGSEWVTLIAKQVVAAQSTAIARAIRQVVNTHGSPEHQLPDATVPVVVSGHGGPLWQRAIKEINCSARTTLGDWKVEVKSDLAT